jgi:hypothetical protein
VGLVVNWLSNNNNSYCSQYTISTFLIFWNNFISQSIKPILFLYFIFLPTATVRKSQPSRMQ